jgi:DNA-binding transcriptional MerR regulator
MSADNKPLPAIPAKRYFTIGEVSELCGVKAYVLRYWEQEFTQLKPMKRRGNRRYYQHHEVLLIRRIRDLLYEQGFTISGARNQLSDHPMPAALVAAEEPLDELADEPVQDAVETLPMLLAPAARDPHARTRAGDAGLRDDALEAMAREDLATIARARAGTGEFGPAAIAARAASGLSVPVGSAGVRAAALEARRMPASATPALGLPGEPATVDQVRAELLAIRALLVG